MTLSPEEKRERIEMRREKKARRSFERAESKAIKMERRARTAAWKAHRKRTNPSLKWARQYRVKPRRPLVKAEEKRLNKLIR